MAKEKRSNLHVIIIFIQLIIISCIALIGVIYVNYGSNSDKAIYSLSLLCILFSIWYLTSWKLVTHSFFHPYSLFLIAAIMFNSGHCFLKIFNFENWSFLSGLFTDEIVIKTIYIVTISLSFLHLGALIGFKNTMSQIKQFNINEFKALRIVGWFLLIISIVPTIYILKQSISIVLNSGYMGLYNQSDVNTGFSSLPNILSVFIVPASIFLLAGSKERKINIVVSLIVIGIYSFIQFFLGTRSAAAIPLICYVWVWDKCIKKINRRTLFISALVMLFVIFPLIGATRTTSGRERSSLNYLIQNYFSIQNPIIAVFNEMGGSMRTVAYTITLIPLSRNYDYGSGYLYSLLTLVPNLFWDIHPSVAHGTYSVWLIWSVDPIQAQAGGGLGYSFIAEAWANFSWFGATIFMFLLGYLFNKLITKVNTPAKVAMLGSFLSFFMVYARGESQSVIRPFVWYSLVPYIMFLFARSTITRKKTKYQNNFQFNKPGEKGLSI